MIFFDLKTLSVIERVFILRTLAIVIQLATVLSVYFVMSLQIALQPLLMIIVVEIAFHSLSVVIFRRRKASHGAIFCQVLADVFFLAVLMSYSGGATNAFVSLLLLPIVIAAVSLPARLLSIVSLASVFSYSVLLWYMPNHAMHQMDMKNHFIGMWANFLLSVIVVTFVVGAMARVIINRERSLAQQREEQLRSEQLLALGVASAQVTHQLATPLSNLQLLFDELIEDYPDDEAIQAMRIPLEQCSNQLGYFRTLATSIRENNQQSIRIDELLDLLTDAVSLQFPQCQFEVISTATLLTEVASDAMLLPALLNLIQNGIKSNQLNHHNKLTFTVSLQRNSVQFQIRDFGLGIKQHQDLLGEKLVKSDSGLGMAILLSNSTFERLGGQLKLFNHSKQGAIAQVTLPTIEI